MESVRSEYLPGCSFLAALVTATNHGRASAGLMQELGKANPRLKIAPNLGLFSFSRVFSAGSVHRVSL